MEIDFLVVVDYMEVVDYMVDYFMEDIVVDYMEIVDHKFEEHILEELE